MDNFTNTVDVIGDNELTDSIIDRSISELFDGNINMVRERAFYGCVSLTNVDLPMATSIEGNAFYGCANLTNIDLPMVGRIQGNTFRDCVSLTNVDLPMATSIEIYAFYGCANLTNIDLPIATSIGDGAFRSCINLASIILRNTEKVCTIGSAELSDTRISKGTGYIYVPSALLDSYKTATYWSTYADQFRALEDYTVDGTTTGELDSTKI